MEKMNNTIAAYTLRRDLGGKLWLTKSVMGHRSIFFLVSGSHIQVPAADLWEEQAPTDTNAIPGNLNLSFSYVK